jgi:uncharacterized protein (TIGR02246 family)
MPVRAVRLPLVFTLACLAAACGASPADEADRRAAEEVRARFLAFNEAWERRDAAFIGDYYAHDEGMLLFFERRQLLGWPRVETLYRNMFANAAEGRVRSQFSNLQVDARGDLAWLATNFRLEVERIGEPASVDEGRQSLVFERRDGRWVVVHRHTSFQAPPGPQRHVPLHTEPGPLWTPTSFEGAWRAADGRGGMIATRTHVAFWGSTGLPPAATYTLDAALDGGRATLTPMGGAPTIELVDVAVTRSEARFTVAAAGGARTYAWHPVEEPAVASPAQRGVARRSAAVDLWAGGRPAFGVFVPSENPAPRVPGQPPPEPMYSRAGGETLAANPLYDFVFLNLEGRYDAAAVSAIAEGVRSTSAAGRKTLIVRIPPIGSDPAAAKARVAEVLARGADGVTIPHIENLAQAKAAVGFFRDAGADVWSPGNPDGTVAAMLMLEDPGAVREARAIADLGGYSILACGIGSLTRALGGDRDAAEAGTLAVLAETRRAGLVNMLTADSSDVVRRVGQGFLALLASGPTADATIAAGRAAAGR